MTLEEYIAKLQRFAEENPEHKDKRVVYSHDDEGNQYQYLNGYDPTPGKFKDYGNGRGYFLTEAGDEVNAVCVN
jgi:hypothetical protein